jgi:hypothetical protein
VNTGAGAAAFALSGALADPLNPTVRACVNVGRFPRAVQPVRVRVGVHAHPAEIRSKRASHLRLDPGIQCLATATAVLDRALHVAHPVAVGLDASRRRDHALHRAIPPSAVQPPE